MAHLSEKLAAGMAQTLHQDLEQYLYSRAAIVSIETDGVAEPTGNEPPADVVLPMSMELSTIGSAEARLYVTYLKPGAYHVLIQVGQSAYYSQVLQSCERCSAEPLSNNYTHHLWTRVLRQIRSFASSASPQAAAA